MLYIMMIYRLHINLKHENKNYSKEELKEPSCNSHIWLAVAIEFLLPQTESALIYLSTSNEKKASRMGRTLHSEQIWQSINTGPQICNKACPSFWSVVTIDRMPLKMAATSALEPRLKSGWLWDSLLKNTHGGFQELWMQTFTSWGTMNSQFSIIVVLGSFSF